MNWLIIPGTIISLIGIVGLVYSAVKMIRAKQQRLDDAALQARLQSAMVLNMAALFLSAIGLMVVVVGILLG